MDTLQAPPSQADLMAALSSFVQASQQQIAVMQEQTAALVDAMTSQAAELAELRKVLAKPSPLTHPNARPSFDKVEACQYLGIGTTMMNDLMATKQIGFHKPNGKVYFTQRHLDAWRDRHEEFPTTPL